MCVNSLISCIGVHVSPSASVILIHIVLTHWVLVVLVDVICCVTIITTLPLVFGGIFVYDLCQGVCPRSLHATALWWFIYHLIEVKVCVVLLGVVQVPWLYCLVSVADPQDTLLNW